MTAINKLVRDKVKPLESESVTCLPPALRCMALIAKIHEEAEEISRDPQDPSEYADILACLMDLANLCGVDWAIVLEREAAKRVLRGGFHKGRFVYTRNKKAGKK